MLSVDLSLKIIEISAKYSVTSHIAAEITWNNLDELINFLLIDHIDKYDHISFLNDLKSVISSHEIQQVINE